MALTFTWSDGGNLSIEGFALVFVCLYVMFGRIARMYAFDNSSFLRTRPVVQVVVLGDIGRSPRMQYHAFSLADVGCTVDFIGYEGTAPSNRILTNRHIKLRYIRKPWSVPEGLPKIFYLLWAPFKALFVGAQLLLIMGGVTQYPNFVFVQNPPSIPTLMIAQLVCYLRGAWFIIDWHNFGYSVLGQKLGTVHPVVKFSKWYEQTFGNKAYAHLAVTKKMAQELHSWGVKGKVITFYDRPMAHFQRLEVEEIHSFLTHIDLLKTIESQILNARDFLGDISLPGSTLLTIKPTATADAVYRPNRPQLIVSSTSWTEDEDFSILLSAIDSYEAAAAADPSVYPKLLFVITGKGPLKSYYEEKISKMQLSHTRIVTLWLSASDYPQLLGCADLGVSLHKSTSGMDLPMKVVDMFGCGLPVCALGFDSIDELVHDGENGLIFKNAEQLSGQFIDLFVTPASSSKLARLRENVIFEYQQESWEKNWKEQLPKLFIDDQLIGGTTTTNTAVPVRRGAW